MGNYVEDIEAETALNHNLQELRADGYFVDAPPGAPDCLVSIGSGELGTEDTLSVAAGPVRANGTAATVAGGDVAIEAATIDPRKDVVYVSADGTVGVARGDAEPARFSSLVGSRNRTLRRAHRPAPDALAKGGPHADAGIPGTPLCVVNVPGGSSSIGDERLADVRAFRRPYVSAERARVQNAPTDGVDVARKTELDGKSSTSHRHNGQALGTSATPLSSIITQTASVTQAPNTANGVARKADLDALDFPGFGASGELVPLGNFPLQGPVDLSTASTTYTELTDGLTRARVPVSTINLTGIAALKIGFLGTLGNKTNTDSEVVYARIRPLGSSGDNGQFINGDGAATTEVSSTSFFESLAGPTAHVDPTIDLNIIMEGRVDAGTVTARKDSVVLYGELA